MKSNTLTILALIGATIATTGCSLFGNGQPQQPPPMVASAPPSVQPAPAAPAQLESSVTIVTKGNARVDGQVAVGCSDCPEHHPVHEGCDHCSHHPVRQTAAAPAPAPVIEPIAAARCPGGYTGTWDADGVLHCAPPAPKMVMENPPSAPPPPAPAQTSVTEHPDCPRAYTTFAEHGRGVVFGRQVNTAEELAAAWLEFAPQFCYEERPAPQVRCPPPMPLCPRHCRQWTPQFGCKHVRRPPPYYGSPGYPPGTRPGFHGGVGGSASFGW